MTKQSKLLRRAIKLRKLGKSYSTIKAEIGVPKSTLSDWFSKESWSKEILLAQNESACQVNRARIIKMNEINKIKMIERHNEYRNEALVEYKIRKSNPLFVAGVSIYWDEGEKANTGRISVVNTDAAMLKIVINFYRKVLNVSPAKIRAGLFLYSDIDFENTLKYWSTCLGLPNEQFIKPHILHSKTNSTKKKSRYGVCNVYVCSTKFKIKMMEWIKLLSTEIDIIT